MKNLTLNNIAKACNGKLSGSIKDKDLVEASCVEIDSRKLLPDGIFIATKGERVDGHSFIAQVAEKGALGVICEVPPKDVDIPYILVEDSFKALKDVATFYRSNLDIPIIGITGSVGKTSTKEFVAGALSARYRVCKTQGDFNNEVGMPLTLLSVRKEHEIAVVEMGISDFGEMTRLTAIARPDVCIITNIGQCHLENLHDRDGVLKAKTEIFQGMDKDGQVYLNGDDDKLNTVKAPGKRDIVFYGLGDANKNYATNIINLGLNGSLADLCIGGDELKVRVPLPGRHMVYNALVAALVARQFGLSDEEIIKGIESVKSTKGRSNILTTPSYTLIDDCYNANPVSMKATIDLLNMAITRKVAVLGDMFELGDNEIRLHQEVGSYAKDNGVDLLICIGELSKGMAESGNGIHFSTLEECMDGIEELLKDNDSILIKASHGMHFEKLVEKLKDK